MTIKGLDDLFEAQARINKQKRNLSRRDDQTAEDWMKLANQYKQIDSRANFTYCQMKAIAMGADVSRETSEEEYQEEWWNK